MAEVAHKLHQAVLERGPRRGVEEAADVFAALEQRHAVPALRGGQRRLQSSRSSADHGDLEGLVRLDAQRVLPFIARARIDGAGDVEQLAGVPGAAFVAAEADPYGIQTVFGILVDQFRLGDEGAPESDHVGLAVADDLICNGRMHIPPDGNDRNAVPDGLFDLPRGIGKPCFRRTGGRRDEVLGFADARRNMERVDPGVDQRIDELERFFKRHAAGKPVVGIVPVRDGEVVADRLADGPDDRERHTQAVFQASPVGVLPMVRQRGHELADQVAVRAVDLQHVETGLPDAAGDLRVGVNDVFDVLDIQHHAFGMVAEARHIRNHGRGEPGNGRIDAATAVDELQRSPRAVRLDGFRQLGKPLDLAVVRRADAPDEGGPARLHGGSFDAHQADAALGALRVIMDQPFGDVAALGGEVGQHGRHDGTIADNQRIDCDGTQQT